MRIAAALLALTIYMHTGAEEAAPGLESILASHQASLGGQQAIEAVDAVLIKLSIVEPTFAVTGRYAASRDGRMRIDIFDGDTRVFSEGFDGNSGWQWHAGETALLPVSPDGERALKRGIVGNLFGLHERPRLGYELAYEGAATIDGLTYRKVSSTAADGFRETFYLDPASGLIAAKQEVSALHPDIDAATADFMTFISDYREHGGRRYPHRTRKINRETGETVQESEILHIEANPANADELLAAPAMD